MDCIYAHTEQTKWVTTVRKLTLQATNSRNSRKKSPNLLFYLSHKKRLLMKKAIQTALFSCAVLMFSALLSHYATIFGSKYTYLAHAVLTAANFLAYVGLADFFYTLYKKLR